MAAILNIAAAFAPRSEPESQPQSAPAEPAREKLATAERALRAAQEDIRALESILDAACDGIAVLDPEGTVLTLSAGAEKLFGRASHAISGAPLEALLTPESAHAARDYIARTVGSAGAGRGPRESLIVAALQPSGASIPVSMLAARLGGDTTCAVFRDVTHMRDAEDALRAAKREAQRAAAAKADFVARLSHELRTPLNAITGFAELMMAERFGPIGNERYRAYLKDIHAAGGHLVSLLNDLLDLSRIEAGQFDLTFAPIDLNALTQQCVGIMQPQASKARIIIRTSLTPALAPILADARAVRQIVLNLLTHSVKSTGPGGQVIISTADADAAVVLRVRDTGAGMSEEAIKAALEPFRQVEASPPWGFGNVSLGLPLAKALAEAHRAAFTIKSAPDAGTLVEITFPAQPAAEASR